MTLKKAKIGILAIQGAFAEHTHALYACAKSLGIQIEVIQIRTAEDISNNMDGIILPGGESTTMGKLLNQNGFGEELKKCIFGQQSPVVWGTCSGLIMLANNVENQKKGGQYNIGGLDITVSRNFFGRQINSFEGPVILNKTAFEEDVFHGVFIRAPAVLSVDSDEVNILGHVTIDNDINQSIIVAVQKGNLLATSFHPELTDNYLWQKYFFKLIEKYRIQA